MDKMVISIFEKDIDLKGAVDKLQNMGYDPKDFSIITKATASAEDLKKHAGQAVGKDALSGIVTGGIIGGVAGLILGLGLIAIPGIGAILIGGPIAEALGLTGAAATTVSGAVTGAVAGGLAGALIGIGVSREDAKLYEDMVRQGMTLLAVSTTSERQAEVRAILEGNNAAQIRTIDIAATGTAKTARSPQMMRGDGDGEKKLVNPIQVEKFLKDIDYPASKEELIAEATKEGADENVLYTLMQLPEREYNGPVGISKELGKIE